MATIQPFRTIISIFDCKIHLSKHSIFIESKQKNQPAFLSLSSEIQIVYLFYLNIWLHLEKRSIFSLIYLVINNIFSACILSRRWIFRCTSLLPSCPKYFKCLFYFLLRQKFLLFRNIFSQCKIFNWNFCLNS